MSCTRFIAWIAPDGPILPPGKPPPPSAASKRSAAVGQDQGIRVWADKILRGEVTETQALAQILAAQLAGVLATAADADTDAGTNAHAASL